MVIHKYIQGTPKCTGTSKTIALLSYRTLEDYILSQRTPQDNELWFPHFAILQKSLKVEHQKL